MTTEDTLIARIVDRTDCVEDWIALDRITDNNTGTWSRLAASLRQDAALRATVAETLTIADRVELPDRPPRTRLDRRRISLVAAGLVIFVIGTWLGSWINNQPSLPDPVTTSSVARTPAKKPNTSPHRQIVRMLAPVMVRTRSMPDGRGVEVTYLRRSIEREVIPSLYGLGRDEHGSPVLQKVDPNLMNLTDF